MSADTVSPRLAANALILAAICVGTLAHNVSRCSGFGSLVFANSAGTRVALKSQISITNSFSRTSSSSSAWYHSQQLVHGDRHVSNMALHSPRLIEVGVALRSQRNLSVKPGAYLRPRDRGGKTWIVAQ